MKQKLWHWLTQTSCPSPNFHSQVNLMKFTYPITHTFPKFPIMLGLSGPNPSSWSTRACTVLTLPSSLNLPSSSFYYPCHNHQTYPRAFVCAFLWERKVPQLLAGLAHSYSLGFILKPPLQRSPLIKALKVKTSFFTQFLSIPPSNFFNTMYHNQ